MLKNKQKLETEGFYQRRTYYHFTIATTMCCLFIYQASLTLLGAR